MAATATIGIKMIQQVKCASCWLVAMVLMTICTGCGNANKCALFGYNIGDKLVEEHQKTVHSGLFDFQFEGTEMLSGNWDVSINVDSNYCVTGLQGIQRYKGGGAEEKFNVVKKYLVSQFGEPIRGVLTDHYGKPLPLAQGDFMKLELWLVNDGKNYVVLNGKICAESDRVSKIYIMCGNLTDDAKENLKKLFGGDVFMK